MGRGCADSLESQEFPIIIPLPFQQPGGREHKNRTPGPSLRPEAEAPWWQARLSATAGTRVPTIQRRKRWFRTLRRAQGSYLLQLSANQGLKLTDPRLAGPPRQAERPAQSKTKYPSNQQFTLPQTTAFPLIPFQYSRKFPVSPQKLEL